MPKYSVAEVLEIIQGFSLEEKAALKAQLGNLFDTAAPAPTAQQHRSLTVGGDFSVGGQGVSVDMSQQQAIAHPGVPATTAPPAHTAALLQALEALQQQVLNSPELNPVEKEAAEIPLRKAAAELQKEQPDKNLIDQSIAALKKGLAGVETLADPVMRVAALVAKAWVIL